MAREDEIRHVRRSLVELKISALKDVVSVKVLALVSRSQLRCFIMTRPLSIHLRSSCHGSEGPILHHPPPVQRSCSL